MRRLGKFAGRDLAAAEDGESGLALPAGLEEEPPGCGGGLEEPGLSVLEPLNELRPVAGLFPAGEFDACARRRGQEEFEYGDVEGESGDGQERVVGFESEEPRMASTRVCEWSVGDRDPP